MAIQSFTNIKESNMVSYFVLVHCSTGESSTRFLAWQYSSNHFFFLFVTSLLLYKVFNKNITNGSSKSNTRKLCKTKRQLLWRFIIYVWLFLFYLISITVILIAHFGSDFSILTLTIPYKPLHLVVFIVILSKTSFVKLKNTVINKKINKAAGQGEELIRNRFEKIRCYLRFELWTRPIPSKTSNAWFTLVT